MVPTASSPVRNSLSAMAIWPEGAVCGKVSMTQHADRLMEGMYMSLDYEQIKKAAEGYRSDLTRFLRAMISHPSESTEEKEVVACIKAEMEKVGFDKVEIDGLGNIIGWMGRHGDIGDDKKIIAIDSHIDTVISTPSASATGTTGRTIRTRDMRQMTSSTEEALPIRKAAWPPRSTARRS